MNRDIRVQPIEPHHLDALLELCREHAAYEQADFQENGQVERWHAALFSEQPALYGWVATDAGTPCGFMTATVDFATWGAEPFAYMDCLYLQEPYRGLGIGRVLFERLREFAAAKGCGRVEWQTPPHNELGIGFYRRMGAGDKSKVRFHFQVEGQGVS
ncbi:N-acetyltransferase family protein [Streptacidiphilus sp. EB103A]|uniref:GNAT family N-acetyltransferase n=1 Tax=Streptacidiphilus sp. EB103A TaxID=3156275 RepID=UPI003515CD37